MSRVRAYFALVLPLVCSCASSPPVAQPRVIAVPATREAVAPRASAPVVHVHLAAGERHACVVQRDGTVACWGSNSRGQLGTGEWIRHTTMTPVAGLAHVAGITAAKEMTCAWLEDGSAFCWGSNTFGEVGPESEQDVGGSRTRPTRIEELHDVVEMRAEGHETCARRADGTVACFGLLPLVEQEFRHHGKPFAAKELDGATQLAPTYQRMCGLRSDGTVRCAHAGVQELPGQEFSPELADPSQSIEALRDVKAIDGYADTFGGGFCALGKDGHVACAHWPTYAKKSDFQGFKNVDGIEGATAIAVGKFRSCAVMAAGALRCWDVDQPAKGTAYESEPVAGLVGVTESASSSAHTCARTADGALACWGYRGELGDGDTGVDARPVVVSGLTSVRSIAAEARTCAVRADGATLCWGSTPTIVDAKAIAELAPGQFARGDASCTLLRSGRVRCPGQTRRARCFVPAASGVPD